MSDVHNLSSRPEAGNSGVYPPDEPTTLTRRNFLKLGLGALSALAVIEAGLGGVLFLRSRNQGGEFGGEIKAGPVEGFPPNSVTEFPDGNFFLLRSEDGGFLAIYRRCPHLGCTVNWVAEKERFYCPCHASSFDKFGNFENQPVPRALDTFPVTFKDETVVVDTGTFERRPAFDPSQLAYY